MSNNKQSSVEWLLSFIEPSLTPEQKQFFSMVIEQAKAMHKEEIGRAYHEGLIDGMNCTPKDYYNETFGGNNG